MEYGCAAITGRNLWDNGKGTERKVLSSEEFLNTPIYGKYTPMTFEDLLKLLDEYPDAFVMIDSKQYSVRNYQRTLEDYAQYREICYKSWASSIRLDRSSRKYIIQPCILEQHFCINFPAYIYSLWQGYTTEELNDIAEFCQTNKIHGCQPFIVTTGLKKCRKFLTNGTFWYIFIP